jgi:hypothetical protein
MKEKKIIYAPKSLILKEGAEGRKMFILQKGQVRVFKEYMGKKITLAVLGPGEIFGELAFFDAAPRSASIEALSEVETYEVEVTENEIKNLPPWVHAVLKTVFHRFRDMDSKLMLLKSIHDFQKKSTFDIVSNTIYTELHRYNNMLKILHLKWLDQKKDLVYSEFMQEFSTLLGKQYFGTKLYFKTLVQHSILDKTHEGSITYFKLNEPDLELFQDYIDDEINHGKFILLSTSAIGLLNALAGHIPMEGNPEVRVHIPHDEAKQITFFKEGSAELLRHGIIKLENAHIETTREVLLKHHIYQSILKSFDHTIIHSE